MKAFQLALAFGLPVCVLAASGTGHTTRYWDCCKPSCAWQGKADVSEPVLTCDANDNPLTDANTASGCDGGSAFACTNNSPWAVNDDLAYGFAATALNGGTESSWCCACYALTFTSGAVAGKTMIVQSTNTGGDISDNQFDLMMPGGGLGIFDGCSPEFGTTLPGAQYGGVSSRSQCDDMPELLKDGCYWRFDWFLNADNPAVEFEQVQCPQAILDVSDCKRADDAGFPAFSAASAATSKAATSVAAATKTQISSTKVVEDPSSTSTKAAVGTATTDVPVVDSPEPSKSAASDDTTTETLAATTQKLATTTIPEAATTTLTKSPIQSTTAALVELWGQCDSNATWDQPKKCVKGSKCVYVNDWYSQCQPKSSCS